MLNHIGLLVIIVIVVTFRMDVAWHYYRVAKGEDEVQALNGLLFAPFVLDFRSCVPFCPFPVTDKALDDELWNEEADTHRNDDEDFYAWA